jgi:hypothetical protein
MSDLLVARRGDESVVLHVPTGTYLVLDTTATEILELVQAEGRDGAAAALAQRYGLTAETARTDVDSVLDRIVATRSKQDRSFRRPSLRGGLMVVGQWGRMPLRVKLAALQTATLLVLVELALRRFGIDAIARKVGAPLAGGNGPPTSPMEELDISQLSEHDRLLIAAADWTLARWVFDATCLRRALLYGWILRHHDPQLHIGLMEDGDVLAHAWLSVDGCTVGAEDNVGDFSRMEPRQERPSAEH